MCGSCCVGELCPPPRHLCLQDHSHQLPPLGPVTLPLSRWILFEQLQAPESPEQQLAITLCLEEEDGRDMLHALNEVLTDEEAADR